VERHSVLDPLVVLSVPVDLVLCPLTELRLARPRFASENEDTIGVVKARRRNGVEYVFLGDEFTGDTERRQVFRVNPVDVDVCLLELFWRLLFSCALQT